MQAESSSIWLFHQLANNVVSSIARHTPIQNAEVLGARLRTPGHSYFFCETTIRTYTYAWKPPVVPKIMLA